MTDGGYTMEEAKKLQDAGRYVCTKDAPWTPDKGSRAVHPDAKEIRQRDGYPGGDLVDYQCPHCRHTFTVELPQ